MKAGQYSVVGGGPDFPGNMRSGSFDPTRTVFSMSMFLKPNHRYEFWLNHGRFQGFESEEGVPLFPVHVTFSTRAAK